ncbi:hypothetical protein P9858_00855 [Niallia circulans]|uniref:hypothetical protein n=1 Tax=Niallia circulans TaxID=1397 RepID=UPI002E1CD985|nr:hypothetical protein [Niallia circulans]
MHNINDVTRVLDQLNISVWKNEGIDLAKRWEQVEIDCTNGLQELNKIILPKEQRLELSILKDGLRTMLKACDKAHKGDYSGAQKLSLQAAKKTHRYARLVKSHG